MRIQILPPCKQNFFALAWPCGAEHIRTAPISVFPQGNTVSICILHANCQGGPLTRLLRLSPAFSRRWDILHITNYDRSPVPSDALEHCSLFLYQHLGPQWGDLASENLLSRLPRNAVSLCLPNLFFMGYWPFWTSDSSMNFGDICLDYLTDKGLSPAEILHVCLHGRLDAICNIEERINESRTYQKQKDGNAIISLENFIDAHWKEEQLFTTVNHPAPKLSLMVANAMLDRLHLPGLPDSVLDSEGDALDCDRQLHQPIHPGIGRRFALPFAGPERRYRIYENRLTFRQYALAYVDCRRKKLPFLAYLACLRAGDEDKSA